MKVLMLGWEFAPKISGGLGVASQELAEALAEAGHEVTFLLPKKHKSQVSARVKLVDASRLRPHTDLWKKSQKRIEVLQEVEIGQVLLPYLDVQFFQNVKETQQEITELTDTDESRLLDAIELTGSYDGQLMAELTKFALLAAQVALEGDFEVVHVHDWITFKAGAMVQQMTGVPMVAHVHSTEVDRNGQSAYDLILEEERRGLKAAAQVVCVSDAVRRTVAGQYGISTKKMSVVPNATNVVAGPASGRPPKRVAFAGRLTHQKNPGMFIDLARELVNRGHAFEFVIMGDGYLRQELEQKVAQTNLTKLVQFTGFLERTRLLQALHQVDLLVVPSVSEPFGLIMLEAIHKQIPVAAVSGVGLAEFVPGIPHVAAWDQYSMVRLVERLMTDMPYREGVIERCAQEAAGLSWGHSADLVTKIYQKATKR